MSNFYDVEIEKDFGEEVKTFKVRVSFDNNSLILNEIKIDENQNETVIPFIVQPWKCLPDGSRQKFVDQDDAFAWFESDIKNTLF